MEPTTRGKPGRPKGSGQKNYIRPSGESRGQIRNDEVIALEIFCERMGFTRRYVIKQNRLFGLPLLGTTRHTMISGFQYNKFMAGRPLVTAVRRPRNAQGQLVRSRPQQADGSSGVAAEQEAAAEAAADSPATDGV